MSFLVSFLIITVIFQITVTSNPSESPLLTSEYINNLKYKASFKVGELKDSIFKNMTYSELKSLFSFVRPPILSKMKK